jgi:RimJ/RimL family protein N-acetyltransferase
MVIRQATAKDRDLLLVWRNDPETRLNSHNTVTVTADEHATWFAQSLASSSRRLFIAEDHGIPVGVVRVDLVTDYYELSWTVAPDARRQGLGKIMVTLVTQSLGGRIKAQIKQGNEASVAIAKAAGLHLEETRDGVMYFSSYADRTD